MGVELVREVTTVYLKLVILEGQVQLAVQGVAEDIQVVEVQVGIAGTMEGVRQKLAYEAVAVAVELVVLVQVEQVVEQVRQVVVLLTVLLGQR
tara:strand:+ start:302 stop:580 length:279 start_codon:yes stop_codon:yes gene_type:complete